VDAKRHAGASHGYARAGNGNCHTASFNLYTVAALTNANRLTV
jgi:hypothetical protein